MPDYLDLGRYNIQLLRSLFPDLSQSGTIMRTDQVITTELVNDINTRQDIKQLFATTFLARVCWYFYAVILRLFFGIRLSFIEQAVLIRGYLLAAGGIAPGDGQVQLFLEAENLGFVTLVLEAQLLVASMLISDQ